jgi:hypothetical protein
MGSAIWELSKTFVVGCCNTKSLLQHVCEENPQVPSTYKYTLTLLCLRYLLCTYPIAHATLTSSRIRKFVSFSSTMNSNATPCITKTSSLGACHEETAPGVSSQPPQPLPTEKRKTSHHLVLLLAIVLPIVLARRNFSIRVFFCLTIHSF